MKLHGIEITKDNAEVITTKYGTHLLRVQVPNEVDPGHRQDHADARYAYYDVVDPDLMRTLLNAG